MKVIIGALLCILAQFAAAWAWYGRGPLVTYARVLTQISAAASILEPKPYLMPPSAPSGTCYYHGPE